MEGFKPVIKMKTGGSVSKAIAAAEKKESRSGMHEDVKEDKKIVKKAINLHDDQLHEGAKTDLSTLKKGGRCKNKGGTVRKYAAGGLTDMIAKGGKKPRPRPEPPGGVEPDDVPYAPSEPTTSMKKGGATKKCGGGKVKKMAIGGLTDPTTQAVVNADVLRRRKAAMGTPGGLAAPAQAPSAPVGQPTPQDIGAQPPGPVMKRGGKVKK